jgi:mannosylfructose-phosphate synthase
MGVAILDGFAASGTHVLMITNHGIHDWQVMPGLPDTGGQNMYVNQFTEALVAQGYRVTIANRGGYPHPVTGKARMGTLLHPSRRARIMYLEDGGVEFVRKEDMAGRVPALVADLERRLAEEGTPVDVIISHYWDAAAIGAAYADRSHTRVPHVWVPHSLGIMKKRNVDPATWEALRIDERIAHERDLLTRLDGVISTSAAISQCLVEDYGYTPQYPLPPCVDVARFHPRDASQCEGIWDFLAARTPMTADELRTRRIVTEISRTDRTKRKDVLIRAFAKACARVPGAALVISLDERAPELYTKAMALIEELGITRNVVVVGSVASQLPCLYAISSVYCTPSVMEGFGMSAQEAAATGTPVISSDLVPFTREYLLGPAPEHRQHDGTHSRGLLIGDGAIIAPADEVDAFAEALVLLLTDGGRRAEMGRRAYDITIPYFTWEARTRELLDRLGLSATTSV